MSQGSHPPDTVWIIVEPDMCMFKVDGASRIELAQGRMPENKFEEYEEFGAAITDPAKRAAFLKKL